MKYITEHMFKAFLTGATIVALILVLMNIKVNVKGQEAKGVLQIIGCYVTIEKTEYSSLTDGEKLQEIAQVKSPEVIYAAEDIIICNKEISLLKNFKIRYYNSTSYDEYSATAPEAGYIEVRDIITSDGTSIINQYNKSTGKIIFESDGIYSITFFVRDIENRENIMIINMPVRQEIL